MTNRNRNIEERPPDWPAWNSDILSVRSDTSWRAKYRLLQSWYRQMVIKAPAGRYRGRYRGNHLIPEWVAKDPHANFLTQEVSNYVDARLPEVTAQGGVMEETRLRGNLLSSQPLCFNLFGQLRAFPEHAATVLGTSFDLDIEIITAIEVEWAPNPAKHLGDRTAFDAYVEYTTSNGRRGFIGIETKYTENFTQQDYDRPEYRSVTEDPASGFKPGAADVLKARSTNQLWRNSLLAASVRKKEGFDVGHVWVLACKGDRTLTRAVKTFEGQMDDPRSLLRVANFEDLIAEALKFPDLAEWASAFDSRYLDLSQIDMT
ncbi:MAG: hypothetical protein HOC77_11640 [Chloroflexi bacterium]|jgi:hypothetical protein|nr:hypothetical protein [Chloroflexota bacterium]MBT4072602.1 hypothetical protein [Chloroflexota bacterium]MBT4515730.1 hypothetical protein [Chloroflexota bacterium]MBT5318336.1 hypothetical protein [Chloroflexota bacterium]MBT6682455.1 hypothetical protein [Chloroflexota bacterium]